MKSIRDLRVKLFADGADRASMLEMYAKPYIRGLTTNPTLMRAAGVTNYRGFAMEILAEIRNKPVCLEVLADDFAGMERQAQEIAGWGDNVYVKIPVVNTRGESCIGSIARLVARQVKVNVTAVMTLAQVREIAGTLSPATPSYVSIFAGRIADTGIEPAAVIAEAVQILRPNPAAELIWASPRELLNIFQADDAGCHIITLTDGILRKLHLVGHDLDLLCRETVSMFYRDARAAGFTL
ncbi:MAG TPA: transaldolase [Povalibacter sp.]|nr:transaldolase [Povalibacter sp.]